MDLKKELETRRARYRELEQELQKPENLKNYTALKTLTQEYAKLGELLELGKRWEDQPTAELEAELREAILPPDPLNGKNIIMEIRAGTGGEEAALFAGELMRMYLRFAEQNGWKTHLISQNQTDIGGFKEVVFEIRGRNVYRELKYEAGVHRVQRIPTTEKSGRIHTSTSTVAVLPEAEEVDIQIDPKDLKIETSTSGGHGGQSVNTTYSAIRITHLPTGTTVSCQDERSQQQNRARAMQILRARLFALETEKRHKERRDARRGMVGTGERAEKLRTYNFPQDRLTDHRINASWHHLQEILDGNLVPIIEKLREVEAS